MRLLIVEDDAPLAGMLARSLREQGYAVDVAPDGEQALYQVAVNEYDLAILDLALPRRDGMEVARGVRARGLRLPILMVTHDTEEAERLGTRIVRM